MTDQNEFDFLCPYSKPLLRPDEVASVFRFDRDTIYTLAEEGKLEPHQGDAARSHIRITRRSVLARLALTARYEADDIIPAVLNIIKTLSPKQRAMLRASMKDIIL